MTFQNFGVYPAAVERSDPVPIKERKLVSREPTQKMAQAGMSAKTPITTHDTPLWLAVWRAMFDAAE